MMTTKKPFNCKYFGNCIYSICPCDKYIMKEELEKEAEEYRTHFENELYLFDNTDIFPKDIEEAYIAGAEPREKHIVSLEARLTTKIVSCIKYQLCKQDEDYDKPIISPKFLSDILDQMTIDGFEVPIKEK